MLQETRNIKNINAVKKENNKKATPDIFFHKKDFEGKKNILIIAKTWGSAKVFFQKTILHKVRRINIIYLYNWKQIKSYMNSDNTIVIKLTGALQNEDNEKLIRVCEGKNIKILTYVNLAPSIVEA